MPSHRRLPTLGASVFLLALLATGPCSAEGNAAADWPQFRGPARDGLSPEGGLLRSWPETGPREVWRRPLGPSFASASIVGDRVYTMSSNGEAETAVCLDAATGEEIWSVPIGGLFEETFGNGPRATPTVDGDVVYVLGSLGVVQALKAADGASIWKVDLQATFGSPMPMRGFAPSALVDGDLLLLEAGGTEGRTFLALDKATGETRWATQEGRPGYSSPIVVTIDGVKQYVFASPTAGGIVALLPDGELHWKHEWKASMIAMPLFIPPNRVFASAGDDVGSILVEVGTEDGAPVTREVWGTRSMKNHFSSSLLHDGHIYGFDNATLKCIDAATGEVRWAKRGFGKGSLIAADGLFAVLGDRGVLALVEADPKEYRELGRHQALESKSWTAPALAGGRLDLRNLDEMVCLDLRKN